MKFLMRTWHPSEPVPRADAGLRGTEPPPAVGVGRAQAPWVLKQLAPLPQRISKIELKSDYLLKQVVLALSIIKFEKTMLNMN